MGAHKTKITGVNHQLSQVENESGFFYFELSQTVSCRWQKYFMDYLCIYRPTAFSNFPPAVEDNRLIRAYAVSEGEWGIASVLKTLQNMINYADNKCVESEVSRSVQKSPVMSVNTGRLSELLANLNY